MREEKSEIEGAGGTEGRRQQDTASRGSGPRAETRREAPRETQARRRKAEGFNSRLDNNKKGIREETNGVERDGSWP